MREGCQQAADLGGGHGDEVAYVVAAMVIMPQACPGKLSTAAGAPFELRRPEGRQARAWTVWRAGTRRRSGGPVVVQAGLVLRVGDRLRGFGQLPAEVELTNPRHPLAGRRVPVVSAYRRGGGVWLVVVLPDGYPAGVRVDDTDLGGSPVASGMTVLSVAGIGRLRELASAMAAGGRDR